MPEPGPEPGMQGQISRYCFSQQRQDIQTILQMAKILDPDPKPKSLDL